MPMLLSSIEALYRQFGDNVLEFEVCWPEESQAMHAQTAEQAREAAHTKTRTAANDALDPMAAWLARHAPGAELRLIGPSEYSGWILGGPSTLTITGTSTQRDAFARHWFNAQGQSADGLFRLLPNTFPEWRARIARFSVVPSPLPAPSPARWFDLPGQIALVMAQEPQRSNDIPSLWDAWWLVQQAMPAFASEQADDRINGVLYVVERDETVRYWIPINGDMEALEMTESVAHQRRIASALGIGNIEMCGFQFGEF